MADPALCNRGSHAWMVEPGMTGTIVFNTPADRVETFLRNETPSTISVLRVFGVNGSLLETFGGSDSKFASVSVSSASEPIGWMTLENSGRPGSGRSVLDDFSYFVLNASFFTDFCNGDGGVSPGCTDCPCGNNATPGTIGGCLNSGSPAPLVEPPGAGSTASGRMARGRGRIALGGPCGEGGRLREGSPRQA